MLVMPGCSRGGGQSRSNINLTRPDGRQETSPLLVRPLGRIKDGRVFLRMTGLLPRACCVSAYTTCNVSKSHQFPDDQNHISLPQLILWNIIAHVNYVMINRLVACVLYRKGELSDVGSITS